MHTDPKLIGENEDKDKMEYFEVLSRKASRGLSLMWINEEGDCLVSIESFNNIQFSTMNDSTKHHIKLLLIGYFNGLF